MRAFGLALGLALLAGPALAQSWFIHEFGELRAYHGDWLAVCEDEGRGTCRLVQSAPDPGSDAFFDQRLSLIWQKPQGAWAVQVMDRGMAEDALQSLTFDLDGAVTPVPAGSYIAGELGFDNVAKTVTITDAALTRDILAAMRAGRSLTVRYTPQGSGNGMARFTLRGVTAGTNAILDHASKQP